MGTAIRATRSVCPVCLKNLPAELCREEDGRIWLEKTCPEHGHFRVLVWEGLLDFEQWTLGAGPLPEGSAVDLGEGLLCTSPEHLPVQMASRLTDLELTCLLSELLGLYAIDPCQDEGMFQRDEPLTTPDRVLAHLARLGGRHGVDRVRRALGRACVRPAGEGTCELVPLEAYGV